LQGCIWNNDGSTDTQAWAQRRHLGMLYQASRNFAAVFGEAAVPSQIRPVYAEWSIFPQVCGPVSCVAPMLTFVG